MNCRKESGEEARRKKRDPSKKARVFRRTNWSHINLSLLACLLPASWYKLLCPGMCLFSYHLISKRQAFPAPSCQRRVTSFPPFHELDFTYTIPTSLPSVPSSDPGPRFCLEQHHALPNPSSALGAHLGPPLICF